MAPKSVTFSPRHLNLPSVKFLTEGSNLERLSPFSPEDIEAPERLDQYLQNLMKLINYINCQENEFI